jgi:hypothetical protein
MNKRYKRHISFLAIFILFTLLAKSQQMHFIYLQTENKQPFYVKMNKKLLSSSAAGYLIIPKLSEGTHLLTVGFPKNEWGEQKITCSINKKDAGYILKNFGDSGWGLFNLQTMEVVMSGIAPIENTSIVVTPVKKEEIIKEIAPELSKTVDVKPVSKEEIKPVDSNFTNNVLVKTSPAIKKIVTVRGEDGTDIVYVDNAEGKLDTIRIFIPLEKAIPVSQQETKVQRISAEEKNEAIASNNNKVIDSNIKEPKPNTELIKQPVKLEIEKGTSNTVDNHVVKTNTNIQSKESELKPIMANSDCKSIATEDDFLKLRKKMAAQTNDDDMVEVARKAFRAKCYITEQIKNISVLFLNDEGKYRLFDAAYPFVSDSNNFSLLSTQLKDSYFIARFKVMLRQ